MAGVTGSSTHAAMPAGEESSDDPHSVPTCLHFPFLSVTDVPAFTLAWEGWPMCI